MRREPQANGYHAKDNSDPAGRLVSVLVWTGKPGCALAQDGRQLAALIPAGRRGMRGRCRKVFMSSLPVLSTIPRSGTWFLRYAIAFLCHLDGGGRIEDRLTGRVVGSTSGPAFDFESFRGGPLFRVRGTLPVDNLFIGHTVCPGFAALGRDLAWWAEGQFHVPGYDYFHEGMNYRRTPVDLAPKRDTPVRVAAMERAAGRGRGGRIALVYRNPIDQAASYYRYSKEHRDPVYSMVRGRPLFGLPFRDYLFRFGLPSYARQFISYQEMAARHPAHVKLMPYEGLMAHPANAVSALLDHLAAARRERPWLADAVWLARREHMMAIEAQLGRSLDGTRPRGGSHIRRDPTKAEGRGDLRLRGEALAMLEELGVDTSLFKFPLTEARAIPVSSTDDTKGPSLTALASPAP